MEIIEDNIESLGTINISIATLFDCPLGEFIVSSGSACGYSFITKKGELFGKRHIYYVESDEYKSMDNYNTLSLREISELCVNKDKKVIHSQGKYIDKSKIY